MGPGARDARPPSARWGGRDLGRGARKDGPAPRGGGLRPGRGCGHAKSAADRRPGTTGSTHRRLRARRYHTGRIFRRPGGGIRSPGPCRAHHPVAPRLPPPRPRSWPMRGAGLRPGLHSRRRRRGRPQGSRDRGARPAAPPQPGVMSAVSPSPVPNGSRRAPRSPVPRASRRTARGAPRRAPGCARDGGARCAPGPVRDGGGGDCAHDSRLGRGGGPRTPVARALWTAPSPPSAVEPGAQPRAAHRPGPGPGRREAGGDGVMRATRPRTPDSPAGTPEDPSRVIPSRTQSPVGRAGCPGSAVGG